MITVWGRATSLNVQKVMWTIAELGLEVERIDKGGQYGGLDTDQFYALNPHRKVPAVRFGDGVTMFESNAIMRRLALHDPERRLWPAGGQAEADADMWAEWAQLAIAPALTGVFWTLARTKPEDRDPALFAGYERDLAAAMEKAETQLGQTPFLGGETLTIADIVFGAMLYRYHTLEFTRQAFPNVKEYYHTLRERPAYATHAMVDYKSLFIA
ncbi:glutathione S-transferase family protein [Acuticoccus sp. MNP-M23]|uniref:glutathione S-transferase family protein n=1 Tax=Acuticoccus sp. MNP-M23 TaxID=3072793 RepID=UPI0028150746|nr:glutathione S-transferase family protein [Acuticoccus sp. MNP-M23]WMS44805.1 glutathione S-transferase family protein [Acuticoccus sp. MNP-M23]